VMMRGMAATQGLRPPRRTGLALSVSTLRGIRDDSPIASVIGGNDRVRNQRMVRYVICVGRCAAA